MRYYILYNMSRERKTLKKMHRKAHFYVGFYLQPLHVLQFPEHFLICLPVEEYISPE